MKRTRTLSFVFAALFPVMALGLANGCGNKKGDDDAPTATAPPPAPPPAPTPTAAATVVPEEPDAGAGDAGVDAGKPTGGGSGGAYTSISKCCAALQQNANSAPPDQKIAYMSAASACQGLKNTPAANQAFAQIRMFLAGAKMPGACK